MAHPILSSCVGERCTICGEQAHHKVGEEFLHGQAQLEGEIAIAVPILFFERPSRHNLTAYLCCQHFRLVMGGTGTPWCEPVLSEVEFAP